jgi:hypothetical protein
VRQPAAAVHEQEALAGPHAQHALDVVLHRALEHLLLRGEVLDEAAGDVSHAPPSRPFSGAGGM